MSFLRHFVGSYLFCSCFHYKKKTPAPVEENTVYVFFSYLHFISSSSVVLKKPIDLSNTVILKKNV